ncbi:double-stranded RNA-specific editase Adar isoform X1 [Bombyx mandarina]|uniref:Double-stranded RNA-specific editase Adar isoform X1 n=1 Tax=Bombyx mandarina TaxID=7092 RepID=A0A6J2K5D7_BOMMA|nr:double-stranded RNA-specific editase Adar isoform X1 [Bombyx mandarina]
MYKPIDFTSNDVFDVWTSVCDITSTSDFVSPRSKMIKQKRKREFLCTDVQPAIKRPAPSIRVGSGFKWNLQALAHAADAVQSGGKSPVSALNELGVRVTYTVLNQGGPAHCPSFTVAVNVADMTFEGWGHSKREARASAARVCLAALLARAGHVLPDQTRAKDFTVDDTTPYPVSEFQCLESKSKIEEQTKQNAVTETAQSQIERNLPTSSLFGATAPTPASKSPINVLYENHPGLLFICTYGDGTPLDSAQVPLQLAHSMRFKVVCQIKEQKFEGYGSSKKLAKLAAARSALAVLEEGRADIADSLLPSGYLSQTLADHIANLVNSKFSEMMKNDVIHSKRKVLAGIVMTTDSKVDGAKVIAVATGTKCVSGEHMSVRGRAVNDCHAEVAARRCLQRHLYTQLLLYASQKDPRKPIPEADIEPAEGGGYRLRPDRQLHMYVSTAPCGDGRIFSPHEQLQHEPDRHPNRLARGQLRTKIESGEGTIPVKNCNSLLQTWDGVMQGERLLTMSCSDKVARWCVLGLQGSLMSTLLAPVYPTSIVLGSLLHPHHLYRAICGRIEAYISSLPPPYHLRRPLLARAASTEARTPTRAPSFSVCWACTNTAPEVLNATTGKLENGQPSLLCKQSMFARWQYLIKKLPPLQQSHPDGTSVSLPNHLDTLLYNEAKLLSPTYQVAKDRLFQAFEKAKLGRWIKKPLEQDQFVCELLSADPAALFT